MRKTITAIIPVYNAAPYLVRCVNSVVNQTYTNWNLILIDDGSTDSSFSICQEYANNFPERVTVIHQQNSGAGVARNTGLKYATGDYIVFIDSDDYISQEYFEMLSQRTEDVVFIDVVNVDESGHTQRIEYMSKFSKCSKNDLIRFQMTGRMPWGGWRKAIKRQLVNRYKISYSNHKVGEEAIYSFQIIRAAGSIGFIQQPLYYYSQRDDSLSRSRIDDPYSSVVTSLKGKIVEMNLYDTYANTINAFSATAAAVSAQRIIRYYSRKDCLSRLKSVRNKMCAKNDFKYGIDFKHMSLKAVVVFICLKLRLFDMVYLMGKLSG